MTALTIAEATHEEVKSGELGRRLRHFNYGFVGEYPESQPVWLNAKETTDVYVNCETVKTVTTTHPDDGE